MFYLSKTSVTELELDIAVVILLPLADGTKLVVDVKQL